MHILLSPKNIKQLVENVASETVSRSRLEYVHWIMNTIEDYRIEKIGLNTYQGYIQEQRFVKELYKDYNPWRDYDTKNEFEKVLIEFSKDLLLDQESDREWLHNLVEESKDVKSIDELISQTRKAIEKIIDEMGKPPITNMKYKDYIGSGNIDPESVKDALDKFKPKSDSLKEEFEEIRKAGINMDKSDNESKTKVKKIAQDAGINKDGLKLSIAEKQSDFTDIKPSQDTVNRLISYLHKWKVGWDEAYDYTGSIIDPEEYLLNRHKNFKGKFYLNEERISPKTDIAILIDMSGSIIPLQRDYLKSMIIIGNALDYVGTNFSIFIFREPYFYIVKLNHEPWDDSVKMKLSSIQANGSTPLANSLNKLLDFQKIEGFKRIVIITDGIPNNPRKSAETIKKIEYRGTNTQILGFRNRNELNYSTFFDLVGHKPGKIEIIHNTNQLPKSFFDLLRSLEV